MVKIEKKWADMLSQIKMIVNKVEISYKVSSVIAYELPSIPPK